MTQLSHHDLSSVAGGIWYGENKRPTGERWARAVDIAAARVYDATRPYVGDNAAGLAVLGGLYLTEGPARWGGRAWDAIRGVSQ